MFEETSQPWDREIFGFACTVLAICHINALLTAPYTCLGISLLLLQPPCRLHYVPLEFELTCFQCLRKTHVAISLSSKEFSAVFFANEHAFVLTQSHIHSVLCTHTLTLNRDKGKLLGLLLLPRSCPLPLPLYASLPFLKEKTCSELRLWYGNVMVMEEGRWGVGDGRWIPQSAAVG